VELRLNPQRLFGRSRVACLSRRSTEEEVEDIRWRKKETLVAARESCILVCVCPVVSDETKDG
jgi:hypothetical protein